MAEPCVLVVASAADAGAAAFAARWHAAGVRVLVPRELSRAGWVFRVGDAAASRGRVGAERFESRRLKGVVVRLGAVRPADLAHVAAADRLYVAGEMSAFLLAWLSALPCPVWNRPWPPSLCGPAWRPAQWRRAAARAGLAVAPPEPAGERTLARCTVVGTQVLGTASPRRRASALALAREAGAGLLDLAFDSAHDDAGLVDVDLQPDLARAELADALAAAWGLAAPAARAHERRPLEIAP